MQTIKKTLLVLLTGFVVSQFFSPEKNDGELVSVNAFFKETQPPENVKNLLKESCYDCHTNKTKYPWYNKITPINYWLAKHINNGKKHFNMSKWEGNSIKRKDHKFGELIEMINDKTMPLKSYTWMHKDSKLDNSEIKSIIDWAKQVRIKYALMPKPE